MNSDQNLFEISGKISAILGLHFSSSQLQDLKRRLKLVARELNIPASTSELNVWLSKPYFSNTELNALATHLTVTESYFFREKGGLELFKQEVVPQLIRQRQAQNRQLRIWCAGCSTGEEPYTIAMIIKEYFPELTDWNITILATDINPEAIQKALQGEYGEWSFRETDAFMRYKYFEPSGNNWRICTEIKKMVTFSYLNLSENTYPSTLTNTAGMDIVFCRNVMMYFTPKVIIEVSKRFFESITENGWLITSQVELRDEYFSIFEKVLYNQGIYYRKSDKYKEPIKGPKIRISEVLKSGNPVKTQTKKSISESIIRESIQTNLTEIETLYRDGHYLQCIESCLHVIEMGRITGEIFALLVKSYANTGLLEGRKEIIDRIIADSRSTSEMYYIYACLLKEQNDPEHSERMLHKAVYLNHNHILTHLMLGELSENRNKKNNAKKHYEAVIALLEKYADNEVVPESDGLTAGGIKALAISMIKKL